MAINAGDSYIDSEDVVSRLEELRNERDELTFIVYRVRNDETIETFDNKNEADEFVDEEDYDPERVKVRMTSKGLDDDDEEELSDLETIDRDGSDIFSDWGSITVQLESNVDEEDYAREYLSNNYSDRDGLLGRLDGYINYGSLGEDLLEDAEGGEINGYNYVYL